MEKVRRGNGGSVAAGTGVIQPVVRSSSLVERAKQHLQTLILNRALRPGEQLPTERRLGEMLGVSRTVVREAVRSLAEKGLIEVTSGSGTYVREVGPAVICDSVDLLLKANRITAEQIFEVRSALEINVAGLAAARAKAADIAAMAKEISALSAPDLSVGACVKHDFLFHMRLAESTGNPLLIALINSLSTVIIRSMYQMYEVGRHKWANQHIRMREHSLILDHIKSHDNKGARQAMASHMTRSLGRLRRARQKLAVEGTHVYSAFSEFEAALSSSELPVITGGRE